MLRSAYKNNKNIGKREIFLAALVYFNALDPSEHEDLFEKGIRFVFTSLSENRFYTSDSALSFVEQGLEQLSMAEKLENIELNKQAAVARMQIDTILCRWTGVSSRAEQMSPIEILFSAQARMRQLKHKEAIALTEFAQASISCSSYSTNIKSWLNFCALYIRSSCLIACGFFAEYEKIYHDLLRISELFPESGRFLVALLPNMNAQIDIPDTSCQPPARYLEARLLSNRVTSRMFIDCTDPRIGETLTKTIKTVSEEGSVEVTFPMNNLGIFLLYNHDTDGATNMFFDLISYSVYPYDYFSAYNNISIALSIAGDFQRAREFIDQALGYIECKELDDPVFVIKGIFNRSLIYLCNGDESYWDKIPKENFKFEHMPNRYQKLYEQKTQEASDGKNLKKRISKIEGKNIEVANLLWPQNLQFWDFMYPIVNEKNYLEISRFRI